VPAREKERPIFRPPFEWLEADRTSGSGLVYGAAYSLAQELGDGDSQYIGLASGLIRPVHAGWK
jgi:hypothetical protein